jgi:hypothetical protein
VKSPTNDHPKSVAARVVESVVTAAIGAALGRVVGGLINPPVGWITAGVGGANGLLSGWRQIYSWSDRDGLLAFVLDSTWGVVMVAGSLFAHGWAVVTRAAHNEASLSTRQNRHVYRRGAQLKSGYTLTLGNVISGAGDVDEQRRRRLITDHEGVHVWQARWFGPLYPIIYALWGIGGSLAGVVVWLRGGRSKPIGAVVQSIAYYSNPFEWWAYSRDAYWPPSGAVGAGWKKPAARPLAEVRAERSRH